MPTQQLYITDSEGMGGAERYLRTLIEHARSLGADVGVVLPERQATRPLVEAAELAGAQVMFADYVHHHGLNPAVIAQAVATLRRLVPTTVHFVLPAPRRSAEWMVAAALAGVPRRIATFQLVGPVPDFGRLAGRLRRLNRSIQYRTLHNGIAVSEENRELLVTQYGFPARRLALIPNGVDTDHYAPQADDGALRARLGVPAEAPLVAFAGRLTASKGPQLLLEAMPAVWRQCPEAHLVIAGAGDLEVELRAHAEGLERAAQVHLPGSFVDIRSLFVACGVFVLPSLMEGLPFAVLEAMAMARAVVATAVGGTPEIIAHHQTGLLIPPGDPAALSEALTRLLAEPSLRSRLGQAARERIVANFSEEQMLARTWELYA